MKDVITYLGIFLEEVGQWNRNVMSRGSVGIVGRTIKLTEYPEATRKEPRKHNHPLSHSHYAPFSNSSGEHVDIFPVFLALKFTSSSLQNAALFRLSGAYPRSLQAKIQTCVVSSNLSQLFWLTSGLQRRVLSNSRRTSLTTRLVTLLT